jgi:nitroreductase
MTLLESLNWRYAAKRMTGAKVSADKIEHLLEAIRLSASGFGLQPYQVFVIENPELKAKIQPIAYGQPQVVESSHLLVFAAWNEVTEEKINHFINTVSHQRNVPVEALGDYKNAIAGSLLRLPQDVQATWAAKQVYLAMGTALTAAAELRIDSTPMEGFVPAQLDELLGLKEKGLHSVLMLAVGERHTEADFMTGAAKVRYPKEEMFVKL